MTIRAPVAASVAEAQLSAVLDTSYAGILLVDEHGRIVAFNAACERLFGYAAADILGTDAGRLVSPAKESGAPLSFAVLREETKGGALAELVGWHQDGTAIPLEVTVGEAQTGEGRQYVAVLRDPRRRRETEQRLSELQADMLRMARISAIDEMGAALAHELNQPLTALMLYLQAIERASARPGAAALTPVVSDILGKALREAERAGNIIQRMRHFVEKREPLRRLVEIAPLIEEAVELTLLGSRPGTKVERNIPDGLPPVRVDPIQIQQVVVNLLRNAVEAVKGLDAPQVRIAAGLEPGAVAITVSDNGAGIGAAAVPDLFKAFSTATANGMGLGLTISKTIAQTHGGDLTVDPGGHGRGAIFTLTLPLPAPNDV